MVAISFTILSFSCVEAMPTLLLALGAFAVVRVAVAAFPANTLRLWNCDGATDPIYDRFSQPCTAPVYCALSLNNGQQAVSVNTTYAANQVLLEAVAAGASTVELALNSTTGQLQLRPTANATSPPTCACAYEGLVFEGGQVVQCSCDPHGEDLTQRWSYDAASGTLRSAANVSLCIDAGSSYSCNASDPAAPLYCQPGAATADRVSDLVGRLSDPELASLLSAALIVESYYGSNAGVPRLGVRARFVLLRRAIRVRRQPPLLCRSRHCGRASASTAPCRCAEQPTTIPPPGTTRRAARRPFLPA